MRGAESSAGDRHERERDWKVPDRIVMMRPTGAAGDCQAHRYDGRNGGAACPGGDIGLEDRTGRAPRPASEKKEMPA